MPKIVNFASFWKPEACGQTVLPHMSILIGLKSVENAKFQNFKCDILSNFWTKCLYFLLFSQSVAVSTHYAKSQLFV